MVSKSAVLHEKPERIRLVYILWNRGVQGLIWFVVYTVIALLTTAALYPYAEKNSEVIGAGFDGAIWPIVWIYIGYLVIAGIIKRMRKGKQ